MTPSRRHLPNSAWILAGVTLVAIIVVVTILAAAMPSEPTGRWVKDGRGVWVAEGTPADLPADVREQQFILQEARLAYDVVRNGLPDLSAGPCLGTIFQDWVADIVHDPREPADDDPANQCRAFQTGEARHFVELSLSGEVVRVE
ncbi:MAG: hypothetical protein HY340_01875 [Candidatus Kerfeldbacteria bacterium]|nr:hypothetical protein [Candidatus Kerfeldbacteria bacterium]